MTTENQSLSTKTKISSRGGARPNSGRQKGSTNKYSVKDLIQALEAVGDGKSYVDQLAEDYWAARFGGDRMLAHKYHHLITSKVFADKIEIDMDHRLTPEQQAEAFVEAMRAVIDQQESTAGDK